MEMNKYNQFFEGHILFINISSLNTERHALVMIIMYRMNVREIQIFTLLFIG